MLDSGMIWNYGIRDMRAAGIIASLMLIFSANAGADLSIQYDSIGKQQRKPFTSVLIKRHWVRIDQSPQGSQSVVINLESGDIVQMHPQSRRYFQTNAQTLGEYARFYQRNKTLLSGLIDHGLRQLHPDKRDQVEQLIDRYKKGPKSFKHLRIEQLPRSDRVLGVQCAVFGIYDQDRLQREVCISSYQQLGLEQQEIRSIEQLKQFIHQFRESAPRKQRELFDLFTNNLAEIGGLPMKIVSFYPDGKVRNIIQASSISLRSIPAQAYRVPEGYQEQQLPVL